METKLWKGAKVIGIQIVIILMMMLVSSCGNAGEKGKKSEERFGFRGMWPARQQLWHFNQPRGIVIDRTGYVFVADTRNHCIKKFTMDGRFITRWGGFGSKDGQFNHVTALAVDQSGNIYAVDRDNHRIQKFAADGRFLTRWGKRGDSNSRFEFPDGIAVDEKGFVYIADTDNHRIQKFTSDGEFVVKWGSWGDDIGKFKRPVDIIVDHAGDLLVADLLNHRVQKFNDKGEYLPGWDRHGDKIFKFPYSMALDSNGNVYVADIGTRQVLIFTPEGKLIGSWKKWMLKKDRKPPPGAFFISFGPKDMVYMADTAFSRILKFTSSGGLIAEWAGSGIGKGEFRHPADVAIHPEGPLYVVDTNNHRIQIIDPKGKYAGEWGGPGNDKGQFLLPRGISVDSKGNVYVADSGNHRIQKFDLKGKFLGEWGRRGEDKGQFNNPLDVAVDSENNVYVVDSLNHRIQIIDSRGEFLNPWGGQGSEPGRFNQPTGIEVSSDGSVYVVDSGNARIQRFSPEGKLLDEPWGKPGTGDGHFIKPQKIALDKKGNVYVADTGNFRVQKFTSKGKYLETLGEKGSLPGRMNSPQGIAVNGKGTLLFVADSLNHRIQLFQRMPLIADTKSIVVAGRGSVTGDYLWDATQYCANSAYLTLMQRGFNAHDIYYLSSDTDLIIENNQSNSDVDAAATNQNLEHAITTWASDAQNLVLYLVDHGGNGVFRTNGNEILNAADLDTWLDTWLDNLQSGTSGNITIVYDACESGSFLNALKSDNSDQRVVITSTSTEEVATFATQGAVSFSSFFWTHVFNGEDIKDSHVSARDAMALTTGRQKALLDANGNGIGNENQDLELVEGKYIGQGMIQPGEGPSIGNISPPQKIDGTSTAKLFAENVTTETGSVARVWAIIQPPGMQHSAADNAFLALPAIDLLPAANNRYAANFHGFHSKGNYKVFIFARDSFGNTSQAYETSVAVSNPIRRRAIVVAGGEPADPLGPTVENLSGMVLNVLRMKGYGDDNITFLSAATNSPTLSNLKDAISSQADENVQDVVLYMVGSGDTATFKLNAAETLTADELDGMLDDLQGDFTGKVVVIYDGSQSGSFLNKLTPPAGKTRILISSTDSDQGAGFISDGDISFSSFFWFQVLNGINVRDAFVQAMNAIGYSGGGQTPLLDDSGNGVGNEQGIDGRLARNFIIGTDDGRAGNVPAMESVSADQILTGGLVSATIQAQNVTTTNRIERVWAVITPPNYTGRPTDGTPLDSIELTAVGDGNFEGVYNKFNLFGIYHIAVFAKDANGGISMLRTTTVKQTVGPDSYEVDDTPAQATEIRLNSGIPQRHNFHNENDQDWVWFNAFKGEVIEIRVRRVGRHADVVVGLYGSDGTTLKGGPWNWGGAGEDETITWIPPETGRFFLKTKQHVGYFPGLDTGYDLEIFRPLGVLLRIDVFDLFTNDPIDGALVTISSGASGHTSGGAGYTIPHPDGLYTFNVEADGYVTYSGSLNIPDQANPITEPVAMRPLRLQGALLLLLLP